MWDLSIAAAVLTGVSLSALAVGRRLSGRWPERRTVGLALIALAAFLLYMFLFHGTWQMARLLPFSAAIVLGNWIPLGGAFLAGVALGQRRIPRWRRHGLATLILVASSYSVGCCFLGHLPVRNQLRGNATALYQRYRSSCGACCAAALLRHHGIEASEEELLGLCMTSYRGCPALGLYRGLKLKTADTGWDVEVVTCCLDELLETEGPLLLRVRLPAASMLGTHRQILSPRRRFEHAVLLIGAQHPQHIRVFDPAVTGMCRRDWKVDFLRECWCGEALRLVPRENKGGNTSAK